MSREGARDVQRVATTSLVSSAFSGDITYRLCFVYRLRMTINNETHG
jgi:hypothetical protein